MRECDIPYNGNVIENEQQGLTNATYNWRNLPDSFAANSSTVTFAYDADGQRVTKTESSTTTYYVRGADGQTLAVYEGAFLQFNNIVAATGELLGYYDGSESRYYLKDQLGSVRTTIEASGNVDGYDDYYPFGLVLLVAKLQLSNAVREAPLQAWLEKAF